MVVLLCFFVLTCMLRVGSLDISEATLASKSFEAIMAEIVEEGEMVECSHQKGIYSDRQVKGLIKLVEDQFPQLVEFSGVLGNTSNGRPISLLALHLNPERGRFANRDLTKLDSRATATLFVSYIMPIDYQSVNAAVGLIVQVLQSYVKSEPSTLSLLKYKTLWIVPILNVDSSEFLLDYYRDRGMVTFVYKNRMSDKYTNEEKCGRNGLGVNLNKNFPVGFNYDADLSSEEQTCSTYYGGVSPFSEPETKSIESLTATINPKLLVALFTANRMLWYPNLDMLQKRDPFIEEFKKFVAAFEANSKLVNGVKIYNPIEHQKPSLYNKGGNIDEYFVYQKSGLTSPRHLRSQLLPRLFAGRVQHLLAEERHARQGHVREPRQPPAPRLHLGAVPQVDASHQRDEAGGSLLQERRVLLPAAQEHHREVLLRHQGPLQ